MPEFIKPKGKSLPVLVKDSLELYIMNTIYLKYSWI